MKKHNHKTLKKLALAFAIVIAAVLLYVQVAPHTHDAKVRVQLESKVHQLSQSQATLQEKNAQSSQEAIELKKQLEDNARKLQEAEKQLQAKKATQVAHAATKPKVATVRPSGTCADWMAQAGIPQTAATTKLIINESGCNPNAVNPSSGACGIPQAYPCSKIAYCGKDPVCQLKWMDTYVKNRYGTWSGALSTWYSRCGSPQGCWY